MSTCAAQCCCTQRQNSERHECMCAVMQRPPVHTWIGTVYRCPGILALSFVLTPVPGLVAHTAFSGCTTFRHISGERGMPQFLLIICRRHSCTAAMQCPANPSRGGDENKTRSSRKAIHSGLLRKLQMLDGHRASDSPQTVFQTTLTPFQNAT